MRGRIASVNDGNFIGSVAPYGYDKVKNGKSYTLVPNGEADTLRLIFRLFTHVNFLFIYSFLKSGDMKSTSAKQ